MRAVVQSCAPTRRKALENSGDISNDRSGTAQVLAGSRRSQLNMLVCQSSQAASRASRGSASESKAPEDEKSR